MTAGDKVAVEDAVEVENPGRIRAIRRAIDLPTRTRLRALTKLTAEMLTSEGEAGAC